MTDSEAKPHRMILALRWSFAAIGAGVALGVAARLAMRLIAWQAGVNPEFSFGGSVEVILFGVVVGTPVALVVWLCRHLVALPRWTGVFAGLLLFAVLSAWPPSAARSALEGTPDAPMATGVVFAAAFAVYGIVLDAMWHLKERRLS